MGRLVQQWRAATHMQCAASQQGATASISVGSCLQETLPFPTKPRLAQQDGLEIMAGAFSAVARGLSSTSSAPHAASAAPTSDSHAPSLAWQVQRQVSEEPSANVYTGPSTPSPKRVTLRSLRAKHQRKQPIAMATAYDYPSAVHVRACLRRAAWDWQLCLRASHPDVRMLHTDITTAGTRVRMQVDQAGMDILLVGDSVAMVVHGHDTTLPISLDEMLVHCR